MSFFVSTSQLKDSLEVLRHVHPFFGMTFLAFKKVALPIGHAVPINFAEVNRTFLEQHYRLPVRTEHYFSPFRTSGSGWVSPEHPRTTLQRIAKDTFGDAFVHEPNSQLWGWQKGYVGILKNHLRRPLPAFDLSVWLFRDREIPDERPNSLQELFRHDFSITRTEASDLFAWTDSKRQWLASQPVAASDLLGLIGPPPGAPPESGAALSFLRIQEVGPAEDFIYEPARRLNVITGDNSLGKTFILEAAWAALTGEWATCTLLPKRGSSKHGPRIEFGVTARTAVVRGASSTYDWDRQLWKAAKPSKLDPGLALFARYDGSFAVWDPARAPAADGGRDPERREHIVFKKDAIWDGLETEVQGKRRVVCNGLVRDWVAWQRGSHTPIFEALKACLRGLSPSDTEQLAPGEPMRLPFDTREFPTLTMPYGDVPIVQASAGIQRVAALAYFLVWSWHEHIANCELSRREPQRRIILLMDEIEAHLHPRWQRIIVPALVHTLEELQHQALPQVHIATHSPMVMASLETVFDDETDALWHLRLGADRVELEQLEFVKRGPADMWLMSEVFGLGQPRSLQAEEAMGRAKELQLSDSENTREIEAVHADLQRWLAQDDSFWPRWLYWAQQRGIRI